MTSQVLIALCALSLAACSSASPSPAHTPVSALPIEAPSDHMAASALEPPQREATLVNARLKLRGSTFSIALCDAQTTQTVTMSAALRSELTSAYTQLLTGFGQTPEDDTAYLGTFTGRVVGDRFELLAWHHLGGAVRCEQAPRVDTHGHGTEPFWSVHFDDATATASFHLADPPEDRTYQVMSRTEGQDRRVEFTLERNGETSQAVFTREPTGDGMSDELYPYRLVFDGLEGCGDVLP